MKNGLASLKHLQFLWLHNNLLVDLPHNLYLLAELDVRQNTALGDAAQCYQGSDLQQLNTLLAEFESGSSVQNTIRIVLVGEGK